MKPEVNVEAAKKLITRWARRTRALRGGAGGVDDAGEPDPNLMASNKGDLSFRLRLSVKGVASC